MPSPLRRTPGSAQAVDLDISWSRVQRSATVRLLIGDSESNSLPPVLTGSYSVRSLPSFKDIKDLKTSCHSADFNGYAYCAI
jgi:hypothetical protein